MLKKWILVVLLLVGAFTVRMYRITNPIGDWHAWRQADTSAVSRNFVKHGINLLFPTYDDISNVQTGVDNPKGYRFVEFPLYNLAQAGTYMIFGHFSLEMWGRLVSAFMSTLSVLFIVLLMTRYFSFRTGIFAGAAFAFVPYSIYYGRVILPDPSMVTMTFGSIYFFDLFLAQKKKMILSCIYFLLVIIFFASALLLKPYAIFFLPVFVYVAYKHLGYRMVINWRIWLIGILSVIPFLLWRWWESHYPEGVASFIWLFNGGDIRFTGAYFYWIFADRLGRLISGYWGLALFVIGFLYKKNMGLLVSFILSSLLYVSIIARGNVQHDYYQILLLPAVAIGIGLGIEYLVSAHKKTGILIAIICSGFMLMFGWYFVRDYFNINNQSFQEIGRIVDQVTPQDTLVVAPNEGDTTLLYATNRKGWPSFEKSLPELMAMGADYVILGNTDTTRKSEVPTLYKEVAHTNDFILFSLHEKPVAVQLKK